MGRCSQEAGVTPGRPSDSAGVPFGATQTYAYDGSDVIFTFNGGNVTSSGVLSRFLLGPQEHQVLAEDTPYSLSVRSAKSVNCIYKVAA